MEVYSFVLCCTLLVSVTAFTIPDNFPEHSKNISFLETAANSDCKCKNGRCVTDNRGKTKCNCAPGYALQDEFTCEKCNCGEKGRCIFMSSEGNQYVKKCICDIGSAEKDGLCIDCHCGENSKCEFEDEVKVCYCIEGFSEKEGICTECNCGFFGECKFESGYKKCTCDQGYVEEDGQCTEICSKVDCGTDAECQFDTHNNIPKCICKTSEFVFDESDKKCKVTCEDFEDSKRCQNGGVCVGQESGNFCTCRDETSGFFCEIVDDCLEMYCGEDALCAFDLETEAARCTCLADYHIYDEAEKRCKESCSYRSCHNGGHCNGGLCDCRPGTSGDFCDTIDECDYLCPKQRDINCTYDTEYEKAFCKCTDEKLGYDPEIRECRPTCNYDSNVCVNGGNCVIKGRHGFCQCLDATEGDFCEKVTECETKDCGPEAACEYDIKHGRAICMCHDRTLSFDSEDGKCKNICSDSSQCENGGSCEKVKEYAQFCRCLDGTKGDFCEEVPGCTTKDCGDHAKCVYDVKKQMAVCVCEDEKYAFDPDMYQCRLQCDDYSSICRNGGICVENGDYRFCKCLPGTYGDLCENVSGCEGKDCGPEAKCEYDVKGGSAICACHDEAMSFFELENRCRNTCSDSSPCENGGSCERVGEYAEFCRCLDGTKGDFCEDVPGCTTKDCGDQAKCVYDVKKQMAVCVCEDEKNAFDPDTYQCRLQCDDYTSICLNGGICVENGDYRLCNCLSGIYGDICENISECEGKDCGPEAKCEYDVKGGSAICVCHDEAMSFFELDNRCRKSCQDETDCKNGGECKELGYAKFCFCLDGTTGDACEIIEECEKNDRKCKDGSQCNYDIQRKTAYCQCRNASKAYDPLAEKCKTPCQSDANCRHRGLCMEFEDSSFCRCKIGTSGELCERVDGCEQGACGDAGTTTCRYDTEKEAVKCICKDADALYDNVTKTCKTCDCGKNSISCAFKDGEKVCKCPEGFGVENGICKKKYCVEKTCLNGKCEIIDDREVCTCFEGYELDGNYCKKLNCTNTQCVNGTCVVSHGLVEKCVCPAGFTLNRGTCIRGDCRPNTCYGGRCETVEGELICICPHKFHLEGIGCYETVCEIQRCFGGKCVVEDGEEICTCKEGYILKNDVCKKILCEKKNCFGGQCHIIDGEEECTCPEGFSLFEDVCRVNSRTKKI